MNLACKMLQMASVHLHEIIDESSTSYCPSQQVRPSSSVPAAERHENNTLASLHATAEIAGQAGFCITILQPASVQ